MSRSTRAPEGGPLRATLPDGTPVVLKHVHPHRESEHEADALERWGGDGAVRLLARDGWTLLLERCEPGEPLSRLAATRSAVLIELLPRLWVPAGPPFRPLADEAAWWCSYLPDQLGAGRAARSSGGCSTRRSTRSPRCRAPRASRCSSTRTCTATTCSPRSASRGCVIDPKPLLAEREFSLAPIIRSAELGHGRKQVLRRLDRLTAELGLDRERARLWTLGATIAWAIDGPPTHVEVARWLSER